MKKSGFEFLDHTADVQVKSWGATLEEAFAQTAYGLMATMTNLNKVDATVEKQIKVEAEDKEALLFDFLSELLYIFDVEDLVFSQISISIKEIKKAENNFKLEAILKGEKFDKEKHEIGKEVKAITYSFMEINEAKDKVEIKIVFDI